MNGVVAILVFVFGIVVVAIGLHEFGHYWTARRFGMRADRYFLGFGPTVWSTRRGETEFGIKALPLGGFVRIQGMNPGDDRLAPVAETVFARDAVAADRRTDADRTGGDLLAQPAVPPASWDRLHRELGRRGLPDELARRLVERARAEAGAEPTAEEARRATVAAAEALLEDSGHPGSLRHRVLHGDEGRFFHDRPARERAVVLVAGSAMHFVQAVVLLFVGFWLFGDAVALPVVQAIQDDSAAAEAGLQPGDELVALDGRSVEEFETIRNYIRARPGEPIELTVRRDERELTLSATPTRETRDGETFGLLGFVPEQETRALPLDEAVRETFTGNGGIASLSVQTVEALGRVFGPDGLGSLFATVAGEEQRDLQGAASPVGLARSTAEGTERFGPLFLLLTLASINVFVGIFNMVPLPPLDGGHIAVLGAEKLVNATRRARGQPQDFTVDPRAVAAVAVPVLVLLGTVFVTVLWLDIVNPIELPQ